MTPPNTEHLGKVGIIAGGGELPIRLARACQSLGRPFIILGIEGWAGPEIVDFEHVWISLGGIGQTYKSLETAGCETVVIAGYVKRPDFSQLKLDRAGAKLLPKVLNAARKGDDALLTVLVEALEKKGYVVVGAETILAELLAGSGVMGLHVPTDTDKTDILKGIELLNATSGFDVGQGVVICDQLVLAIEAAEGTDLMLRRSAELPKEIRGDIDKRRGCLVKIPKKGQEKRVDLPTIGVRTVEMADRAGLAGIAVAAGGALILDPEKVISAADKAGLFVLGIDVDEGIS